MISGTSNVDKDLLVFFDSETCFDCKDFYRVFEEVAKDLATRDHLVFAYVDMSRNEL